MTYKEHQRQWRQKNKERLNRKSRIYYQEHKAELRVKRQKLYQRLMRDLKINGCAICGYDKCNISLVFHHVNPKNKKYSLVQIDSLSNEKLISELNKCILLCCNCHGEIHSKVKVAK